MSRSTETCTASYCSSSPLEDVDAHENLTDSNKDERKPLPFSQLISVFLIQGAEPVTATVIYPFINQFIRDTGITKGDEAKTGYYAGIIESAFFFAECVSVVQWGYLSDRYGRRPVLLSAPLGLAIAMLVFGSSTTFWPLLWSRCSQGIFNGCIGVAKSVIAELTDSTNRGDAYAFSPLIWNTGVTIGPILGGILSNPEAQWPDSLGRIPYLRSHPYFLPCLIAAIFSFAVYLVTLVTLKETSPAIIAQRKLDAIARDGYPTSETSLINSGEDIGYGTYHHPSCQSGNSSQETLVYEVNPGIQCILTRPILITYMNHLFLTFLDMSYLALIPLMYSTPLQYGGLGLGPFQIGFILAAFGITNALVQAVFLGRMIRKYGARKVYIFGLSSLLVCFSMYPCMKYFSKRAQRVDALTILCILIQFGFQMINTMADASVQILLVEHVPEGGPLGTANGILQMLGSAMRTIAPTFASSMFSISLQKNLAGGNMVYCILFGMTLIGICCSWTLPNHSKGKKRSF